MKGTLVKIMAGGQTGVDQGALKAGLDFGIEIGGYCPPGRVCEDGKIPVEFTLTETREDRSINAPDIPRSGRTELNVMESHGTLIIKPSNLKNDEGTNWTIMCCIACKKPYMIIDSNSDKETSIERISAWLTENNIKILNTAGPGEKIAPGVQKTAYEIVKGLL